MLRTWYCATSMGIVMRNSVINILTFVSLFQSPPSISECILVSFPIFYPLQFSVGPSRWLIAFVHVPSGRVVTGVAIANLGDVEAANPLWMSGRKDEIDVTTSAQLSQSACQAASCYGGAGGGVIQACILHVHRDSLFVVVNRPRPDNFER